MPSSQNNAANDRQVPKDVGNKADSYADEIDLVDYFKVLWKRKYLIVLGSALPALLAGFSLHLSPGKYKLTYLYYVTLTEKSHRTMLHTFHSAENSAKLRARLREDRTDGHSQGMIPVSVQLEISPSDSEAYAGARNTDTRQAEGTFLALTIVGGSNKEVEGASPIVRDNFERILPIHSTKEELDTATVGFKTEMANIEKGKFDLALELETKRLILGKLRNLEPASSDKVSNGIVLQFDNVGQNSEYLPLNYQIQATKSKIIKLEESVRVNQEKYRHYERLVNLNERLVGEIENQASSYYTLQQFHSWLTDIVGDYEDKELADYLNAYIKRLENVMSTNTPVVDKPSVSAVPKGSVKKKSTIVFVLFLIITTFAAFLIEAVQKRRTAL
ncbi:MAG: Wzz/FepE/Etk N-terminal domain-containing protein [Planctomycetota bacterium]|jgi:hypothetical protein